VIIGDFHIIGVAITPHEADPVLIVNPDTELPLALTLECFQPVPGQNSKVVCPARCVNHSELLKRKAGAVLKAPALSGRIDPFGFAIAEGLDQTRL